ncbi:MAG TPA: carbohydrate binding family 9 domain-containing protein, partial [Gemmatimonadales bacterium]|nr:carbohydrate binding family 9 domain-containing protein [Gemmatimonadales bacterium]
MTHPAYRFELLALLGVVLAAGPVSLAAQDAQRVARPARITTPPQIDGRLDEAVWQQAEPLTGFVQRAPSEGAPSTERTEVRILTDGAALYIGAWLFDRQAAGIVAGERVRDGDLTNSDYVAIIFDTFADRQNGFVFATTPAGIEYDGQVIKEGEGGGVFQQGQSRAQAGSAGGFNLNWDASWTVAARVDSLGWYAEFRIPFSTLRYGGARQQT